jgi:glutaredoxin 2
MRKIFILFLVFTATFFMESCKEINDMKWWNSAHKNDRLLAKAGNRSLYMSDLENLLSNNARKDDSARLVNAYIDRWARESAMMLEAEKLVAKDANMDKMVNEYRASLLLAKYESNLIEMNVDTIINDAEIRDYYDHNKSKFELEQKIVRCHFVKIKKDTPKLKDAEKWWNSKKDSDFLAFKKFATTYAEKVILNDNVWYSLDDLNALLPKGSNIDSKKEVIIRGEKTDYNYFLRVLELVDKQTAPLDYVKDQIRKMIFHNRKAKKLDEQRRITYDKAVQQSNVKIYTQ